jgi:hypothetical protein
MNGPHLSDIALIVLAARRGSHPHIESCAWCREQYEALLALEDIAQAEDAAETSGEKAEAGFAGTNRPFRLAAQNAVEMDQDLVLRQTWYLDEGSVIVRVFEENKEYLVGYVICDPARLADLRLRFSGIDQLFTPAHDGSFRIGSATIPIEPMAVEIEPR